MVYDKILIVGSNTVACNCLDVVCEEVDNSKVIVIETSDNRWSMLRKRCEKKTVHYECICESIRTRERLDEETNKEMVLIISANNRYIFKKDLVEKSNVDIINFHYALLPQYRGSNIPSWVIYNNEPFTGITWHYVTAEIDHGNILSQRKIDISPDTTAFDIIKEGMRLSKESFLDFFHDMLDHYVEGVSVDWDGHEYIYLAKMLPNDGIIDIENNDIDTIDRVLRAYDHHGMNVMTPLQVLYDGEYYYIGGYKIYEVEPTYCRSLSCCNESLIIHDKAKKISIEIKTRE